MRVDRQDEQFGSILKSGQLFLDELACAFDILLASHEDQDVSWWLLDVDGDCLLHCRIHIIVHCCLLKVFLDWKDAARDEEDGRIAKEGRELLSVHGGRCDDDLDVPPLLRHLLQDTKEDISVEAPLMRLVHYDCRVHLQFRVIQALSEEHSICHVFDYGMAGRAILESDRIAHCAA